MSDLAQGALFDGPPAAFVADPVSAPIELDPAWVTAERRGTARATDPATSADAADLPGKGTDRARVLDALVVAGDEGLTDFELAARVRRQQTSAGKRRLELERQRLVVRTDETREAPSGAKATVFRVTTAGVAAHRALVDGAALEEAS